MARIINSHDKKLHPSAYGGVLRNRRQGRGARSISTRFSMHLVLRSSLARGAWSFVRPKNESMIHRVLAKHAKHTSTEILGIGNAGNHLHLRVQFTSRKNYLRFIRSVTGEIALHIKKITQPVLPNNSSPKITLHNTTSKTTTAATLDTKTSTSASASKASTSATSPARSFWDRRPFSSIVSTLKYVARLTDYIHINSIEGQGYPRAHARLVVQSWLHEIDGFDG
jgi:REP element-mobilizing transposase RayT